MDSHFSVTKPEKKERKKEKEKDRLVEKQWKKGNYDFIKNTDC